MGKHRTRPPKAVEPAWGRKCTTGSATYLEKRSDGNQAQGDQPVGPSRITPTTKKEKDKRQKWSREDYK